MFYFTWFLLIVSVVVVPEISSTATKSLSHRPDGVYCQYVCGSRGFTGYNALCFVVHSTRVNVMIARNYWGNGWKFGPLVTRDYDKLMADPDSVCDRISAMDRFKGDKRCFPVEEKIMRNQFGGKYGRVGSRSAGSGDCPTRELVAELEKKVGKALQQFGFSASRRSGSRNANQETDVQEIVRLMKEIRDAAKTAEEASHGLYINRTALPADISSYDSNEWTKLVTKLVETRDKARQNNQPDLAELVSVLDKVLPVLNAITISTGKKRGIGNLECLGSLMNVLSGLIPDNTEKMSPYRPYSRSSSYGDSTMSMGSSPAFTAIKDVLNAFGSSNGYRGHAEKENYGSFDDFGKYEGHGNGGPPDFAGNEVDDSFENFGDFEKSGGYGNGGHRSFGHNINFGDSINLADFDNYQLDGSPGSSKFPAFSIHTGDTQPSASIFAGIPGDTGSAKPAAPHRPSTPSHVGGAKPAAPHRPGISSHAGGAKPAAPYRPSIPSQAGGANPAAPYRPSIPSQVGGANPAASPFPGIPSQAGGANSAAPYRPSIPSQVGGANPAASPFPGIPSQAGGANSAAPYRPSIPSQVGGANPAAPYRPSIPSQVGGANPAASLFPGIPSQTDDAKPATSLFPGIPSQIDDAKPAPSQFPGTSSQAGNSNPAIPLFPSIFNQGGSANPATSLFPSIPSQVGGANPATSLFPGIPNQTDDAKPATPLFPGIPSQTDDAKLAASHFPSFSSHAGGLKPATSLIPSVLTNPGEANPVNSLFSGISSHTNGAKPAAPHSPSISSNAGGKKPAISSAFPSHPNLYSDFLFRNSNDKKQPGITHGSPAPNYQVPSANIDIHSPELCKLARTQLCDSTDIWLYTSDNDFCVTTLKNNFACWHYTESCIHDLTYILKSLSWY